MSLPRELVVRSFAALFFAVVATGCPANDANEARDVSIEVHDRTSPPIVRTTFFPLLDFARAIGRDWIAVDCPLPIGADPIFWKPTAEAVGRFQTADLVLTNGAEFEKWLETVSLSRGRVVSTASEFADEFLQFKSGVVHKHGPSGSHEHVGVDGHTWVSPRLAKRQARKITDAFAQLMPDYESGFEQNYRLLAAELDDLEEALRDLPVGDTGDANSEGPNSEDGARGSEPRPVDFYASHPAYDYLARDLGWTIVNLDLDPEAPLTEAQLADLRSRLFSRPAKILLWESEPLDATRSLLERELGLKSVTFSPAENPADRSQSYVAIQRANVERLRAALER